MKYVGYVVATHHEILLAANVLRLKVKLGSQQLTTNYEMCDGIHCTYS